MFPLRGAGRDYQLAKVGLLDSEFIETESKRHPKCLGSWGHEMDFDCGYKTTIECCDCKYGGGRKNPAARCNQS